MKRLDTRSQVIISLVLVLLFWGVWVAVFGPFLRAQGSSSWLQANPVLGQREEIVSGELPESLAFAGNIPCTTTTFRVRPPIPPLQTAETAQACAVITPNGKTAPGGYTNVFKTDAKLFNDAGGPVNLYPVPGGSGGVVLESTAQGTKLHYYSAGVLTARREFNPATREMRVYMPTNPSWTLKDKAGKPLYVRPESISFSGNGQWMVADSAFVATLRVNLSSGEVVPFSSPYVYHIGLSVIPNLSISDDGQTVVTTSDRGDFKMTDVASCATVPSSITGPVTCSSVSHEAILRAQIPGYYRVYQPRFLNDRRLSLYVRYNSSPTVSSLAKFRMAPLGDALESQDYLALGDSYVSGEGAYDYFPETDTTANMCHLSRRSYPYLIGQQLNLGVYNSVACSGAKIQDIISYAQKQNLPSPNNLGRLLPGYKKQLQYVRDQNPNLITVGIGGNDIGFGDIVKKCIGVPLVTSTCYESYEDRLELVRKINQQFDRLVDTFSQIKNAARQNSKLYVMGYPHNAKVNGDCALNVQLNNQEIIFVNQLIDYLNNVIELSAAKAGVRYANVADAFYGHRMCENSSNLVAMNGATAGDNRFGLIGNEGYHPNSLGHQLFKQKILERSQGFSQAMPSSNPNLKPPAEDSGIPLLSRPKSNRPVREVSNDDQLVSDVVTKGQTYQVAASSKTHWLQPNSTVTAELHSTPTVLGTFKTDAAGDAKTDITIPIDTPSGYHSLHILGKNILGTDVDIYKTVYVASTESAATYAAATSSSDSKQSTGQGTLTPQVGTEQAAESQDSGHVTDGLPKVLASVVEPLDSLMINGRPELAVVTLGLLIAAYAYKRLRRI